MVKTWWNSFQTNRIWFQIHAFTISQENFTKNPPRGQLIKTRMLEAMRQNKV
jgi:hypothetical protein